MRLQVMAGATTILPESPPASRKPSRWIVSPGRDLALFVATPLLIIPAVALLRQFFPDDDLGLFVASFGAMGHHLPGMIRAYGDAELFRRFRVRFIVAPAALLVLCQVFAHQNLSGLIVVTLLWGYWHGMAQVYGFARIYDARQGIPPGLHPRLDLALCLVWFAAGLVFSPSQTAKVMEAFYNAGGPLLSAATIHGIKLGCAVLTAGVTVAWLAHLATESLRGRPPSPVKVLLLAGTIAYWWYAMVAVSNPLVGIALFEIFHDVQYLSIVWFYNQRRAARASGATGLLRFLFRPSGLLIGLYVGLVFGYGSINLLGSVVDRAAMQATIFGAVAASSLLHFYYDGFIWKVRDPQTRAGLGLDAAVSAVPTLRVPRWLSHAGMWLWLVVPLGMLVLMELGSQPRSSIEQLQAVLRWAPNSPQTHSNLGAALAESKRYDEAIAEFHRAIELDEHKAEYRVNLGWALLDGGHATQAAEAFRAALAIDRRAAAARRGLGMALVRTGRLEDAARELAEAVRQDAADVEARDALARLMASLGQTSPELTPVAGAKQ